MNLDGVRIGGGAFARGAGADGENCVEAGGGAIFGGRDGSDDLRAVFGLVFGREFAGDGFDDVERLDRRAHV